MTSRKGEFETHKQDLTGTGDPAANSDLKRDPKQDDHGNISGERTADGSLDEKAEELSATEYVEDLDPDAKKTDEDDSREATD
ncbi:MAG TPA: hypothetical protein VGE26_03790 [Sphingobacteriaceae bacterium]